MDGEFSAFVKDKNGTFRKHERKSLDRHRLKTEDNIKFKRKEIVIV
jgi:hypothetical protein